MCLQVYVACLTIFLLVLVGLKEIQAETYIQPYEPVIKTKSPNQAVIWFIVQLIMQIVVFNLVISKFPGEEYPGGNSQWQLIYVTGVHFPVKLGHKLAVKPFIKRKLNDNTTGYNIFKNNLHQ